MKKVLFTLSIILLSAGCTKTPIDSHYATPLQVGGKKIFVQIVTSSADMEQGLSGRKNLADDQGMLFNFGKPSMPNFWMKDMEFNLDFIWIAQGKVVGITPGVPKPISNEKFQISNLPLYSPPSPVDEVLEVNAGWSARNKIKVGDEVK